MAMINRTGFPFTGYRSILTEKQTALKGKPNQCQEPIRCIRQSVVALNHSPIDVLICPYLWGHFLGGNYPGCELVPDPSRVLSTLTWNILGKVILIWTGLFN